MMAASLNHGWKCSVENAESISEISTLPEGPRGEQGSVLGSMIEDYVRRTEFIAEAAANWT